MTYGPKNTEWYFIAKNQNDNDNVHYGIVDPGGLVETTREIFLEFDDVEEYYNTLLSFGIDIRPEEE
jgi:hypothetical protein